MEVQKKVGGSKGKGQTSDPFLFVVHCCYDLYDDSRLSHSHLLKAEGTKNLSGLSLRKKWLVGSPLDWLPEPHGRV